MLKRLLSGCIGGVVVLWHLPVAAADPQPHIPDSLQGQVKEITDYYQHVQGKMGNNPQPVTHGAAMQPLASPQAVSIQTAQPSFRSRNQQQNRAYTPLGRDPFAITNAMLQMDQIAHADIEFTQIEDVVVPTMRLRGLIDNDKENKLAALLEVDGLGVFVVREGDTIGLQGVGSNSVLLIEQISNLSLVVKAGHVGQRFIVR